MKNFFSILLGLAMIGYLIYVVVQVARIALGMGDSSWSDISIHLIVVGVLILLIILGQFWGDNEEETKETASNSSSRSETSSEATMPEKALYNPQMDNLQFSVYQQSFKTWWYDNDGDQHHHSTIYANLRFYEDGTVIGIRSAVMPKKEVPDSFTMKGKWTVEKNQLSFALEKVSEVDDRIVTYISEAERREMKYAGQIADDNSLITAGNFKGTIQNGNITMGNHVFTKIPLSKLIVTASEKTCGQLEAKVAAHPDVVYTFQDTGNWYTNGETGPEWFTVHIGTSSSLKQKVEELVNQELQKIGDSGNLFWDWG